MGAQCLRHTLATREPNPVGLGIPVRQGLRDEFHLIVRYGFGFDPVVELRQESYRSPLIAVERFPRPCLDWSGARVWARLWEG